MEKKDDIRDRLFKVTSDFKVISDFNESQRDEKESQFFEKRSISGKMFLSLESLKL